MSHHNHNVIIWGRDWDVYYATSKHHDHLILPDEHETNWWISMDFQISWIEFVQLATKIDLSYSIMH